MAREKFSVKKMWPNVAQGPLFQKFSQKWVVRRPKNVSLIFKQNVAQGGPWAIFSMPRGQKFFKRWFGPHYNCGRLPMWPNVVRSPPPSRDRDIPYERFEIKVPMAAKNGRYYSDTK